MTPYQRRQHKKKFSLATKDDTSFVPPSPSKRVKLAHVADIGDSDGSVPTIDHPESSTSATDDADDAATLEEIVPTVDLYGEDTVSTVSLAPQLVKMMVAIVS